LGAEKSQRNDKAGDDKKYVHANKTTGQDNPGVKEHHRNNGNGAKALDVKAKMRARWACH